MTALEDSKEGLTECASRWGGYKTVSNNEAAEIRKQKEALKAAKNRRFTELRRNAEEKLTIKDEAWL